MQITITEALSELKLLKSRIEKGLNTAVFATTAKANTAPVGYSSVDTFNKKSKASYQSINELIEQRNKIKAYIVKSNALTNIVIADKTYTVAEAIERKGSIQFEKDLLRLMTNQLANANSIAERQNQVNQNKLDSLVETTLGKEKSDLNAIKPLSDNFWAVNKIDVIDPIGLQEEIEKLSNCIDEFLSAVDTKLTISNSVTTIEV